jgi:hypothetical protein
LYNSIYRADDQVLVNTHVFGVTAAVAPVWHLRKLPAGELAETEQANTRKVCGRILRRVAAEFGEDIAPDAASAWSQECRGRQGHPFGGSSSAARSFTIKAMN